MSRATHEARNYARYMQAAYAAFCAMSEEERAALIIRLIAEGKVQDVRDRLEEFLVSRGVHSSLWTRDGIVLVWKGKEDAPSAG